MNRQEVSALAGALKRDFALSHPDRKLQRGHILDAIARALSYRDWNAASAALETRGHLVTPAQAELVARVRQVLSLSDAASPEVGWPLSRLTSRYLPTRGLILCGGPNSLQVARLLAQCARDQLFDVVDFEQPGEVRLHTREADVWVVAVDDDAGVELATSAPTDALVIGVTQGDARGGLIEKRIRDLITSRSRPAPNPELFGRSLPVAALLHGERVVDISPWICPRLAGEDPLDALAPQARTWWRGFRAQGEAGLVLSLGTRAGETALALGDHARAEGADVFGLFGQRSVAVRNVLRFDPALILSITEGPELIEIAFEAALVGHTAVVAYQSGCFPGVLGALVQKARRPGRQLLQAVEEQLRAVLVSGHLVWTQEAGGPLPELDEFASGTETLGHSL